MITVQRADFDPAAELAALREGRTDVGGVALFVGQVRDVAEGSGIHAMELEHYPGMTEKELARVDDEAHRRWGLTATRVVHRHGLLYPGDNIVLVAAAAGHREPAFDACRFLIDWLKTRAPFWKREHTAEGARWVAAKEKDDAAAARWEEE